MVDYETKYRLLIQTLTDANDAGLFDLRTSQLASIDSHHRQAIRAQMAEVVNTPSNMSLTPEHYEVIVSLAQRANLCCRKPVEIDFDEEVACEKCENCLTRKRLQETGLPEFKHMWQS